MEHVFHNRKGSSLIEILVALLLTAIVFTALLQTTLMSMNQNVDNLLRDEAVSVAEVRMNQARNTPFTALVSDPADVTVTRDYRNVRNFPFTTRMTVAGLDAKNSQVTINVTWTYKNKQHAHSISTVVTDR